MDLTTNYLGLELQHPIVASASPLTASIDGIRRLADAGAAAIVMTSIYEEQVVAQELQQYALLEEGAGTHGEVTEETGYFPELPDTDLGVLGAHLEVMRLAAETAGVPIIGSLNGATREGWGDYAVQLEQAGADALELNVYRVPADPLETSEAVEASYVEILRSVKERVRIPVSIKLGPYFSSPGNMAMKLVAAGADGLVMFSRFYEPDIDLASLTARPDLKLSEPYEIRLPLMWTALLSDKLGTSLAANSGVETHEEVVKYLLVGADAVMTTSSLLRNGPEYIGTLVAGLREWMDSRGFESVDQLKGRLCVSRIDADPGAFMRAQYYEILTQDWDQMV